MAILRKPTTWRRPKKPRLFDLTAEEQARVRAAVRVLAVRVGSIAAVARAMGTTRCGLDHMIGKRGKPTPGLAISVARLAKVPVDDVLSGAFPKPGSCPMCGRVAEES